MHKRIESIDGLRAFAVLGVVWVHVWMFFQNIPWNVRNIDVNRIISFGRNGVDLFFVISGFCMYMTYATRSKRFDGQLYKKFLIKRFRRIAPAYYVLLIVETIFFLYKTGVFPYKDLLYHVLFINIFLQHNMFSPHYWSLATEWQFYLVLPLLFAWNRSKNSFTYGVVGVMIICILFRLLLFYQHQSDLLARITVDNDAIWYRFVEFGMGILAGKLYLEDRRLPGWLMGWKGFILSFLIAYFGRICMLTEFVVRFHNYAFIVRAFSEPIMTFGFALMMYGLVMSDSVFRRLVCLKPVLFVGKISYSMYLWHWLVSQAVCFLIMKYAGIGLLTYNIAFLLSVFFSIPIAWISYKLIEEPYFRRAADARPAPMPADAVPANRA